jgi:hypothetical protein
MGLLRDFIRMDTDVSGSAIEQEDDVSDGE